MTPADIAIAQSQAPIDLIKNRNALLALPAQIQQYVANQLATRQAASANFLTIIRPNLGNQSYANIVAYVPAWEQANPTDPNVAIAAKAMEAWMAQIQVQTAYVTALQTAINTAVATAIASVPVPAGL